MVHPGEPFHVVCHSLERDCTADLYAGKRVIIGCLSFRVPFAAEAGLPVQHDRLYGFQSKIQRVALLSRLKKNRISLSFRAPILDVHVQVFTSCIRKAGSFSGQKIGMEESLVLDVREGKMGGIEISHCPGGLAWARLREETPPKKGELKSPSLVRLRIEIPRKVPPLGLETRMFSMILRKREAASRHCRSEMRAVCRDL